jgi:hypothetical protein
MSICDSVQPPGSLPLTFMVSGIEPPEIAGMAPWERSRFWSIVGIIAERVKQDELAKGLDRFGKKLRPVKVRKVRFRRSGRVVDGEPLMPHRGLSRTRRLLRFTVLTFGVVFSWGNGWARILDYHRRGACLKRKGKIIGKLPVRDVFGISPKGMEKIKAEAARHWRNGTMPEKKIAGNMADSGLGIELPFDSTATRQAKGQGKAKPIGEWTQFDFLAAGVNVVRSNAQTRTANTATGTPGLRDTGLELMRRSNRPWKFAK